MEIALVILHSILIGLFLWVLSRSQSRLKPLYFGSMIFKVVCGIALGLIYKFHYTNGDTFSYFHDASTLSGIARTDPQKYFGFMFSANYTGGISEQLIYSEPRSLFFTKMLSVPALLTSDNYWLISIYCSLVSFFACWFLFRTLSRHFPQHVLAFAVAFLFFPSAVFWSSGVMKETLACAALFFLAAVLVDVWFRKRIGFGHSVTCLLAIWVLWNLKYYYAAVFLPVAFACMVYRFIFQRSSAIPPFRQILVWCIIFLVPLVLMTFAHPNFYPGRFMEVIVANHDLYSVNSHSGDRIEYNSLEPSVKSLAINTPLAVISGLFRPSILDADNLFQWLAAFENFLILILTVFAAGSVFTRKIISDHIVLLFSAIVFILLLADFLSLSTPNFGTLSRYRVAYLPFYVAIVLLVNPLVQRLQRKAGEFVPY
jgi:hypothetical protein